MVQPTKAYVRKKNNCSIPCKIEPFVLHLHTNKYK